MPRSTKVILSDEDIENLKNDYENGLSFRELEKKYYVSTTTIRKIIKHENKTQDEKIKHSTAKAEQRTREIKRREEVRLSIYEEIVRGEYIDISQAIRDSIKDMLELNDQVKKAIPEIISGIEELNNKIDDLADPKLDRGLLKYIHMVYGMVNSVYAQGKLRIESRKELGNWIDRYKEFEMQVQLMQYYENVLNALFEGLNKLNDTEYAIIKETAIGSFEATARYFNQNEEIPEPEIPRIGTGSDNQ